MGEERREEGGRGDREDSRGLPDGVGAGGGCVVVAVVAFQSWVGKTQYLVFSETGSVVLDHMDLGGRQAEGGSLTIVR